MKFFITGIFLMALVSCKTKPGKQQIIPADSKVHVLAANYKVSQAVKSTKTDTADTNEQLDAFADYYILVADTGTDYNSLRDKMVEIKKTTGINIDTLGRYYNKSKDLIMLPDTDKDEIYAGDYFPRRYPSRDLSVEYMDVYHPASTKKTLGLIVGIYENKAAVDSALRNISLPKTAFAFKSKVYVGCMH